MTKNKNHESSDFLLSKIEKQGCQRLSFQNFAFQALNKKSENH